MRRELAFNTPLVSYYEDLVGRPMPVGADDATLFCEMASLEDSRGDRISVPTGIAIGRETIGVAIGRSSLAVPGWPDVEGELGAMLSYAESIVSHATVWDRPDSSARVIERAGGVDVARVVFLLEFRPGDRRPVAFNLVWSSARQKWLVEGTAVGGRTSNPEEWIRWAY